MSLPIEGPTQVDQLIHEMKEVSKTGKLAQFTVTVVPVSEQESALAIGKYRLTAEEVAELSTRLSETFADEQGTLHHLLGRLEHCKDSPSLKGGKAWDKVFSTIRSQHQRLRAKQPPAEQLVAELREDYAKTGTLTLPLVTALIDDTSGSPYLAIGNSRFTPSEAHRFSSLMMDTFSEEKRALLDFLTGLEISLKSAPFHQVRRELQGVLEELQNFKHYVELPYWIEKNLTTLDELEKYDKEHTAFDYDKERAKLKQAREKSQQYTKDGTGNVKPPLFSAVNEQRDLREKLLRSLFKQAGNQNVQYFPERIEILLAGSSTQHLAQTSTGANALHYSAYIGDVHALDRVNSLMQENLQAHIDDPKRTKTPLHWALKQGNYAFAERLIALSANMNAIDQGSFTPLLEAAQDGRLDTLRFCLQQEGVNKTVSNFLRRNALHLAAENGDVELVKFLLATPPFKSMSDHEDYFGFTPLDLALMNKRDGAIRVLVGDPNLNPTTLEEYGKTPVKISQGRILPNLLTFLKLKKRPYLQIIDEEGHCAGLSFLAPYYQSRGTGDEFYCCLELLANWDGT